jgi:hypothetical protein
MKTSRLLSTVFLFIVLISITVLAATTPPPVKGKYLGNNKEAKLNYGLAIRIEDSSGEPTYQIVLTEKDPAKSSDPAHDAWFGQLGNALRVKITKSGKLIGNEICHQSLKRNGVSTSGTLNVENLKIDEKTISGRLFTNGPQEIFDETWEADLTIAVPIRAK